MFYKPEREAATPRSTKLYKEMKKLVLFAMIVAVLGIFNACEKSDELIDQSIDEQLLDVTKPDVYSENGYLVFKGINAVDSIIAQLSKMTKEEKRTWEDKMGFKSASANFDALFDEYDKIESQEEFIKFKQKHEGELIFNEKDPDDWSIDYPFQTRYFFPILNQDGIYKIGNSLVKYTPKNQIIALDGDMTKINDIESYKNDERLVLLPSLKSVDLNDKHIYDSFEDDNIDPGVFDVWSYNPDRDRRLRNELWRENYWYEFNGVTSSGWKIVFYQKGQKENWRGKFKDYKTVYGVQNVTIKVGTYPTHNYHTNNPSYTGEVYDSVREFASAHQNGSNSLYYYRPSVIFSTETISRGVHTWYPLNH